MRKQLKRALLILCCVAALCCIYAFGASAYEYNSYTYDEKIPSNWQDLEVTVGSVTMPFSLYPDGSWFDPEKCNMYREEQQLYGFDIGSSLYLRGWECVGFARYAYAALFYKFPANASIGTDLAYGYSYSYAYSNAMEEVLGKKTLSGFDAATAEKLFKACAPGAVMRIGGHSMVVMAIFDDGLIIYDANFAYDDEVDVRKYTWSSFANSFGHKEITGLHMPTYYPGFNYSTGGGSDSYDIDTSTKGEYKVNISSNAYLNVRSKPSTSSSSVGKLYAGDEVYVIGTYNGWAKIDYQGVGRWLKMEYLKIKAAEITVKFDANGGKASYTSATYEVGEPFGSMPTATKSGRIFGGWYNGYTCYTQNSTVPIVSSLGLKAKWCVLYSDVDEDAWYVSYVQKAYDKGLLENTDKFYPDDNASRAEVVTMLGKVHEAEAGTLSSVSKTPFSDISASSSYAKYVVWGNENGIVKGFEDNTFRPDNDVTREQIAVFLYRHANYCKIGYEAGSSNLSSFADGDEVSSWAVDAMSWAVDAGIFQGNDINCLNPLGNTKRREMVTVFCRYLDYMATHEPEPEPEPEKPVEVKVTLTLDPNGGDISKASLECVVGKTIGELPVPTKSNRTFAGWYCDGTEYTADSAVPETAITLTAKWMVLNYSDLDEGHWSVPHVEACYEYGMFTGSGTFGADEDATRAEVVTMLGRGYEKQSGSTIADASSSVFTDVDSGASYFKYVVWAYDTGLTKGKTETEFAPNEAVTREQLVLFLYRMACNSGAVTDGDRDTSNLDAFSDAGNVDGDYRKAMSWAISEGIIEGDDQGMLEPDDSATHAELATVIHRYLDAI